MRWASIVVVLLALGAHLPAIGGGWVYDDHRFIELNPAIERVDPIGYFRDPATASASGGIQHDIYRPLRTLSFALERQVFRLQPLGWHVISVILHAFATWLVLRLLLPLVGGRPLVAGAGAAIFAVHPAAVECVAWVSSRGDLLAVVGMLLALVVLERGGVMRTILGAVLMALACLGKESALVLPALLLLRDLALPEGRGPRGRETALRVGVLAAVAAAYLAVRLQVIPDPAQVPGFPGGSRLLAARAMLTAVDWYGRLLVWPTGFPFDTHLPLPLAWTDPAVVRGTGLLLTLLLAGGWGLWRRDRRLLTFATWGALACLVPVSNVVVPLKALAAERFLYPVLVCAVAGVAWGVGRLRRPWGSCLGVAAVAIAVLLLVPLTWQRGRAWASDHALWEAVLRDRPTHMPAYEGLGWEFQQTRPAQYEKAERAYRAYLEYSPTDGKTWWLLGNVLGEVAGSLKVRRPQPDIDLEDLANKRNEVNAERLRAYWTAIRHWQQLGLERARGSPGMVRAAYDGILEASFDIGGARLLDAKRANDDLIALEGLDPTDPGAVLERASPLRRRWRYDLAWKTAMNGGWRELPPERARPFAALRTRLLSDAGLAPEKSDREVLAALLPVYRDFVESGIFPDEVMLELTLITILDALGRREAAKKRFESLQKRHPKDPLLQRAPAPPRRPR